MDTGLWEDDVIVYPQRIGSGFSSREYYEVERDAVKRVRAVNQSVKVPWTRTDEFTASRPSALGTPVTDRDRWERQPGRLEVCLYYRPCGVSARAPARLAAVSRSFG
jgi:hypothetical protein